MPATLPDPRVKSPSPMIGLFRCGIALVGAVAAYFFAGWLGAAVLSIWLPTEFAMFCAFLGSAVLAVLAARHIWRWSGALVSGRTAGVVEHAAAGAAIVGGVAFCGGFFGPIIFAPDANQGPLLGLFITGPLGVVAGGIAGAIYGLHRMATRR